MLVARPSHPNAAKLFLQWFFSKEGQSLYAPKQNAISVRKDIPQDHLPPDERYKEGDPFLMGDPGDFGVERNEELSALMRQIFQEGK
jgi:ABC-type Fe3+ transport system substrate-binding protein